MNSGAVVVSAKWLCARRQGTACLSLRRTASLRNPVITGITCYLTKPAWHPNKHPTALSRRSTVVFQEPIDTAAMIAKHHSFISSLLLLTSLALPTLAFIDSPMDWVFARDHTRGLVCPSRRYGCCPDVNTWRHGSPCRSPKATKSPEDCYKKKEWACCQVEVSDASVPKGIVDV